MAVQMLVDRLPEPADGEDNPYALVVVLHANPADAETVNDLLLSNVTATRAEPGNVLYHLNRDRADPNTFYFYEAYRDIDAFRAHLAAPYITELLRALPPYLARDNEMIFLSMSSDPT